MQKELVISNKKEFLEIALIEDGKLTEMHQVAEDQNFAVGDFYLGRVKKLAVSLNAAFVDIGHDRPAFLHYQDLGSKFISLSKYVGLVYSGRFRTHELKGFKQSPDIDKNGTIDKILKVDQKILVQITKEAISTKGPRVTSELSIAGRFLVLVPFSDKVSISQKIKDVEQRKRLTDLVKEFKPEGFGVIIRTVAKEAKMEELKADLFDLLDKWKQGFKKIRQKKTPVRVLSEISRASTILRDSLSADYTKLIIDDSSLADELKQYLETIAPEKAKIVQKYNDKSLPVFEKLGIEREIKKSLGKTVNVPESRGGYLVIEHTEALHVIDVNSGNSRRTEKTQEESAFDMNIKAATEIARQLRLRDMGGIIVVDFIDQSSKEFRTQLFEHFRAEMAKDTAKHKILPPSKFGLVQITRQRVRPELNMDTLEPNPNPNGEVEAPILLIDAIENDLKKVLDKAENAKICLHIHPFVASYIKRGLPSIQQKWFLKYKKWIKIYERDSYRYLQYAIKDAENNVLSKKSN